MTGKNRQMQTQRKPVRAKAKALEFPKETRTDYALSTVSFYII